MLRFFLKPLLIGGACKIPEHLILRAALDDGPFHLHHESAIPEAYQHMVELSRFAMPTEAGEKIYEIIS